MWEAWALRAGRSMVDQSMLTYLEGPGREVEIPHVILLLKGSSIVLVDTSFGSPAEIADAYPQQLHRPEGEMPAQLLSALGLRPADVDLIIHTHLHYDHVGNNHLFPEATKMAQARELEYADDPCVPLMRREYFAPRCGFPAQFESLQVTAVEGDATIAPGLELLALPGHTPGSQGVLVQTPSGPFCFAGDLVMVKENMDAMTPVGLHTDLAACEQSRLRLESLAAPVVPSHDMRLFGSRPIQKLDHVA